jgi:hypothetical protein
MHDSSIRASDERCTQLVGERVIPGNRGGLAVMAAVACAPTQQGEMTLGRARGQGGARRHAQAMGHYSSSDNRRNGAAAAGFRWRSDARAAGIFGGKKPLMREAHLVAMEERGIGAGRFASWIELAG